MLSKPSVTEQPWSWQTIMQWEGVTELSLRCSAMLVIIKGMTESERWSFATEKDKLDLKDLTKAR